jgi:pimeloyl-ACP methyl ester carboxylesterase
MPRARRIEVGPVGTRLIEAGPENASEAVVFVHGNPGSSGDWVDLVDAVGEFGRAVAFDMPGFGQADKPDDFEYHVGSYANFIQSALEQLGIKRVHLVVHDFGGPFGLVWGLMHPDAWASTVLFNIGVMPGYTWHKRARQWRTPVLGELQMLFIPRAAWRRNFLSLPGRKLPVEFVDEMYDNFDRRTRRAVLKLYRATPDPGESAGEVGAAIKALNKPALVIWGMQDAFLAGDYADRQREFFDVRDVVKLDDSGHWPFKDNPEAVNAVLLPYLREQLSQQQPATAQ